MPAKWQQWMPFKIDAFKSSPAVQAMHPCARAGYLYLLACAWQTDDCTISSDSIDLAEMSGLGDELWAVHGPRILRKFGADAGGRLMNLKLYEEWSEAKRVYESRQNAADRTNKHRWSNGDRSLTDKGANRSADTRTLTLTSTGTNTETEVQKQKPSPKPRLRGSEVKHSTDPRHIACKAEIFSYYRERNEGEDPDWEGREGRALGMFLSANPKLTAEGMKKLLAHRAASAVNHSERPALWISKLTSFRMGPLNEFGKPLNGHNPMAGMTFVNGSGRMTIKEQKRQAFLAMED